VIPKRVCNGSGSCVPSGLQSCNGYRCSAGVCGTTCADDSACVVGGFCSSSACVASSNLAGNGDLETGTTSGWMVANGGGTLGLSAVAASGAAHAGGYSVVVTNRSQLYQGPGYVLPTGPGRYAISAWGLQQTSTSEVSGLLQVRVTCKTNTNPGYYLTVQDSGFGVPMPQGAWTLFTGTVDTAAAGPDCNPNGATPGLVRSATVYLNHTDATPVPYPDLYLDDLVVQVTDGHNLVGNPNFEADLVDGWSLSAGSSVLAVSALQAHGGTKSLRQSNRSVPAAGPRWALPIGAGRYAVSFWVLHAGTQLHDLVLQPTYTCLTPNTPVTPPPIAMAAMVPGNTWTQLTGTVTFPPANATAGCKLAVAAVYVRQENGTCGAGSGQIECPDFFIDDVSITLAP
jgi:hypothetical protein